MDKRLQDLREHYALQSLDESEVLADPIAQFRVWFNDALESTILEPNAFTLSTSVQDIVHSRVLLLKEINAEGFIFYTNYDSDKGKEIEQNSHVSLNFLWKDIQRQVRVEGVASKISEEQSLAYAQSRPRSSQIGAWVSAQSQIIKDRSVLENRQTELEEQFKDIALIPKPPHWGGYLVKPNLIEFWQGRPSRLHDRLRFTKDKTSDWAINRLAP